MTTETGRFATRVTRSNTGEDDSNSDADNTIVKMEADDSSLEDAPFDSDPEYQQEDQAEEEQTPDEDHQGEALEEEEADDEDGDEGEDTDSVAVPAPAGDDSDEEDDSPPALYTATDEMRETWKTMRETYRISIGYTKPENLTRTSPEFKHHLDYINERAIPQPPDGLNAKPPGSGHRCLTCIRYGLYCKGTSVEGGRCEHCRGLPSTQKRKCLWIEPEKNIWTYPDAQKAIGGTTIPGNTRYGKKLIEEARRRRQDSRPVLRSDLESNSEPAEISHKGIDPLPTHVDQLVDEASLLIISKAAQTMRQRSMLSQDPLTNVESLFNVIAERNHLPGLIEGFKARTDALQIQLAVLQVLRKMKENDSGLTAEEIVTLASLMET